MKFFITIVLVAITVASAQKCFQTKKVNDDKQTYFKACLDNLPLSPHTATEEENKKFVECLLKGKKLLDDGPVTLEKIKKLTEEYLVPDISPELKEKVLKLVEKVWNETKGNASKFFFSISEPMIFEICPDDIREQAAKV